MKPVESDNWYTAKETAGLLNDEVTEATIKGYCKRGRVKAKQVGPRRRWMIQGSSILKLRREWKID